MSSPNNFKQRKQNQGNTTAAAISFYDSSFRPRTNSMAARKRKLSRGVKEEKTVDLKSPTSIQMKNTFIIKTGDSNFDVYYKQIAKRKLNQSQFAQENGGSSSYNTGLVKGKKPQPRDGHAGLVF